MLVNEFGESVSVVPDFDQVGVVLVEFELLLLFDQLVLETEDVFEEG